MIFFKLTEKETEWLWLFPRLSFPHYSLNLIIESGQRFCFSPCFRPACEFRCAPPTQSHTARIRRGLLAAIKHLWVTICSLVCEPSESWSTSGGKTGKQEAPEEDARVVDLPLKCLFSVFCIPVDSVARSFGPFHSLTRCIFDPPIYIFFKIRMM